MCSYTAPVRSAPLAGRPPRAAGSAIALVAIRFGFAEPPILAGHRGRRR